MKRARLLFLMGLGVVSLSLTGCWFFITPVERGVVEGYVTDSGAGGPVVGTKVTACPVGYDCGLYWAQSPGYFEPVVYTDETGYYRLILPAGKYYIVLEKEGYAGSKVETVIVEPGESVRLNIIQKKVFNPGWSTKPPQVTLTGVNEGDVITGPVAFEVEATSANDIYLIYAAFGKTPGASYLTSPRFVAVDTPETGTITLDPAAFGVAGETTFEVVVYDYNENRTHIIRRVFVTPTGAPGTFGPPANLDVLAVTLSRNIAFYSENEAKAAPLGGNLYVELEWDLSPDDADLTGYRIYRKFADEDEWELIYTVGPGTGFYRDSSPELAVGREVSYKVVGYVDTGSGVIETAPTNVATTTPLPPWDVRLLYPADGETNVSLMPVFKWEAINPPGKAQYYEPELWDTMTGNGSVVYAEIWNETEWDFAEPGWFWENLQPHRRYQWTIYTAIAFDVEYEDGDTLADMMEKATAVSYVDLSDPLTQEPMQMNTFTTGDWEPITRP